jgi:PKD repeat protein
MATWVLTNSGGLPSVVNGALSGNIALTAAPADFDANAITEIRLYRDWTLSGQRDDTYTDQCDIALYNDSNQSVVSSDAANVSRGNGTFPSGATHPGQPSNVPSASGNYLRPVGTNWSTFSKSKGNDNATASISAITVEIDYTPLDGPVASFTKDKDTILTGQSVQFTDTSTGNPDTWSWDFDGGSAGSSAQNPSVVFPSVGVFNVALTASNAIGSDTSPSQAVTVLVREAEIWNGSAWVGGESWNGSAWVTPEVWDGIQWVPVKAP